MAFPAFAEREVSFGSPCRVHSRVFKDSSELVVALDVLPEQLGLSLPRMADVRPHGSRSEPHADEFRVVIVYTTKRDHALVIVDLTLRVSLCSCDVSNAVTRELV